MFTKYKLMLLNEKNEEVLAPTSFVARDTVEALDEAIERLTAIKRAVEDSRAVK